MMTALTDWLDGLESMAPAKNQRTQRRLGGSAGVTPDRPRLIVIHTMETPEDTGRARSTAIWVRDSGGTAQVSCHFTADDQEAIRCVEDEHVAFTQLTPWNDMSLSIEQAGRAAQTDPDWHDAYSNGQRKIVARLVAAWCQKWAIPPVYLTADDLVSWRTCTGITTHHQISLASQRKELTSLGYKPGNHWDPGPNYPMGELLAEVAALLQVRPTDPINPLPDEDDDMRGWQDKRYRNVFYASTGFIVAPADAVGLTIVVEDPGHDGKLAACCRASWGIEGANPGQIIAQAVAAGYLLPV